MNANVDKRLPLTPEAFLAFQDIESRCTSGFMYATADTVAEWIGADAETTRQIGNELLDKGYLVKEGSRFRLLPNKHWRPLARPFDYGKGES